MIVSILQLMGFPMGMPVHSRAVTAPEGSARRQEVNAKPGKDQKTKPAAGKAKPVAKPVKSSKPQPKPAGKPTAKKPVAKLDAKKLAAVKSKVAVKKPVAKAPSKAAAKVAVKAAPKTVKKPVPKAPVKAAPKAVQKPIAKSAPKRAAAPMKAVARPLAKPVKPPVAKAPKPTAVSKPKAPVKSTAKEKVSPSMSPSANKPVPVSAVPVPAAVPQKTGRPSSRLAQLTVPSMAQSVASTAAKSSYTQAVTAPLIVPVLPSSIKKDPKLANNWKSKAPTALTDAELMAMPDSEYMNEVQMAAFRNKLSVLKQDILNSAGETTEHLREDTSVVPDPADRATIEEEHALELRTRDRERKLLKKIEQSIARIDAGDYGYCDETGEPIGVGRLLARPTATLSLEAQQRRELKQKMFGD
jgi:DnaK suppressor protein